ncbi:hypothetical protein AYI70_g7609 [Smittium culicis]|uniref:Uncharacterized protein n=1 Tax=Smittium culicis TaxID=133412 RepID=A0A1R1XJT0_9FUNG|nr:hypothetical protein AYI70_g7609 [Smittium culicis]
MLRLRVHAHLPRHFRTVPAHQIFDLHNHVRFPHEPAQQNHVVIARIQFADHLLLAPCQNDQVPAALTIKRKRKRKL